MRNAEGSAKMHSEYLHLLCKSRFGTPYVQLSTQDTAKPPNLRPFQLCCSFARRKGRRKTSVQLGCKGNGPIKRYMAGCEESCQDELGPGSLRDSFQQQRTSLGTSTWSSRLLSLSGARAVTEAQKGGVKGTSTSNADSRGRKPAPGELRIINKLCGYLPNMGHRADRVNRRASGRDLQSKAVYCSYVKRALKIPALSAILIVKSRP